MADQSSSQKDNEPQLTRPDTSASTLARNFGEQLDGVFNLGGETEVLSQTIQEKKETISSQSRELEELEARLRAADEALRQATNTGGPANGTGKKKDIRDVFPTSDQSVANNRPSAPADGRTAAFGGSSGSALGQQGASGTSRVEGRVPTPLDPQQQSR